MSVRLSRLRRATEARLTAALAAYGFERRAEMDATGLSFSLGSEIRNTTQILTAYILDDENSSVATTATIALHSSGVAQIIGALPIGARISPILLPPDLLGDGEVDFPSNVDGAGDSFFQPGLYISSENDIDRYIEWFSRTVESDVIPWFAARNNIEVLVTNVMTPERYSWFEKNINPGKVRATVALCLVNEEWELAAQIMKWYLRKPRGFNSVDSIVKAGHFDKAMRTMFADYSALRN
ncbi:hypothetical protein ACFVJ5_22000 [Nocardia sp. NPDC127606]|uniref:hypothetical protein n=1 Tax=Nocardia sp. NPDC127606 TaxID=3345406 RepID=UPI0036252748